MSDGGIYLESFKSSFAALIFADIADGSHIMQSVGELYNNNSDIIRHREEHLADIFRLRLCLCLGRHFSELCHAVN